MSQRVIRALSVAFPHVRENGAAFLGSTAAGGRLWSGNRVTFALSGRHFPGGQ